MKTKEQKELVKRICEYIYNKNVLKYDTSEEEKSLSEIVSTLTSEEKKYIKMKVLNTFEEYLKKPSKDKGRII